MANIFIALPAFGGQIFANCANSIIHLTHTLREQGHDWHVGWVLGESLVPRARNTLVHKFLKTDCTHLLFIDCDIVFKPEHVLGLINADKELVGGAYPKKALNVENIIDAVKAGEKSPLDFAANYAINIDRGRFPIDENGDVTLVPDKGCIPIMDLPTGFMLTKRSVFLDMANQMPELEHDSDEQSTKGEPMFAWFDCAVEDRRYYSEDYMFSRRIRRMGYEAWLYVPAELVHIGTHAYRGDLNKTFRLQTPETVAAEAKERASSVSATGGATEWCDIPSLPDSDPQKRWHVERYEWAYKQLGSYKEPTAPKRLVVNAACGTNYGAKVLAGFNVVGLDRSRDALAMADRYPGKVRRVEDLESEDLNGFNTLISLETIEHLRDPWGWMSRLAPSVRETVISVPIIPTKHYNPYHLHDFTSDEVLGKLGELGWDVKSVEYQDEYQPRAVLLAYAVRP